MLRYLGAISVACLSVMAIASAIAAPPPAAPTAPTDPSEAPAPPNPKRPQRKHSSREAAPTAIAIDCQSLWVAVEIREPPPPKVRSGRKAAPAEPDELAGKVSIDATWQLSRDLPEQEAARAIDRWRFEVTRTGERLQIRQAYVSEDGGALRARDPVARGGVVVSLPHAIPLEISAGANSPSVRVEGDFTGHSLTCSSSGASIRFTGLAEVLQLTSATGDVDVNAYGIRSIISTTKSGDISLSGRLGSAKATSDSGGMYLCPMTGTVEARTKSGIVHLRYNEVSQEFNATVVGGKGDVFVSYSGRAAPAGVVTTEQGLQVIKIPSNQRQRRSASRDPERSSDWLRGTTQLTGNAGRLEITTTTGNVEIITDTPLAPPPNEWEWKLHLEQEAAAKEKADTKKRTEEKKAERKRERERKDSESDRK